jgi:hypothetical protein
MRYFVLIFIFAVRLFGQDKAPVTALLTALEGEVTVVRPPASDPLPAQILGELFPGDQLKTGTEGSATILYQDGKIVTISKNSSVVIPEALPDSVRGGRSIGEDNPGPGHPGQLVALIAEGEKIAVNLAVRGEEDTLSLNIYEPGNTALLSGRPSFAWGSFPGAKSYRVKVQRMGSDVWSVITVDTVLPYPENKPELGPGAYLLRIIASTDRNDTLSMTDRAIRILAPEQGDTIRNSVQCILEQKPDSFTYHLLAAKIYETRYLRAEAIREYEALLLDKPDLPFIHLALSILYKEKGQIRPANLHYDRWRELTSAEK